MDENTKPVQSPRTPIKGSPTKIGLHRHQPSSAHSPLKEVVTNTSAANVLRSPLKDVANNTSFTSVPRSPLKDIINNTSATKQPLKTSKIIVSADSDGQKDAQMWRERTEVLTRIEHQAYSQYASELLNEMVDGMKFPIGKTSETVVQNLGFREAANRITSQEDSDSEYESAGEFDETVQIVEEGPVTSPRAAGDPVANSTFLASTHSTQNTPNRSDAVFETSLLSSFENMKINETVNQDNQEEDNFQDASDILEEVPAVVSSPSQGDTKVQNVAENQGDTDLFEALLSSFEKVKVNDTVVEDINDDPSETIDQGNNTQQIFHNTFLSLSNILSATDDDGPADDESNMNTSKNVDEACQRGEVVPETSHMLEAEGPVNHCLAVSNTSFSTGAADGTLNTSLLNAGSTVDNTSFSVGAADVTLNTSVVNAGNKVNNASFSVLTERTVTTSSSSARDSASVMSSCDSVETSHSNPSAVVSVSNAIVSENTPGMHLREVSPTTISTQPEMHTTLEDHPKEIDDKVDITVPPKGCQLELLDNLDDPNFDHFASKVAIINTPEKVGSSSRESESVDRTSDGDMTQVSVGSNDIYAAGMLPQVQTPMVPNPVQSQVPEEPRPFQSLSPDEPKPVTSKTPEKPEPVTSQAPEKPEPVTSQVPQKPEPVISQAPQKPEPVTSQAPEKPEPVTSQAPEKPEPITSQAPEKPEPVTSQAPEKPEPVSSPAPQKPEPVTLTSTAPQKPEPVTSHAPQKPEPVTSQAPEKPEPVTLQKPEPVTSQAPEKPEPVTSQVPQKPEPVTSQVPQKPEPVTSQALEKLEPVTSQALEKPEPVTSQALEKSEPVTSQALEKPEPVTSQAPEQPEPVTSQALEKPEPVTSQAPEKPEPVTSQVPEKLEPVTSQEPTQASQEAKPVPSQTEQEPKPSMSQASENPKSVPLQVSVEPKPEPQQAPEEPKPVPSVEPKPVTSQAPQKTEPFTSQAPPEAKPVTSQAPQEPKPVATEASHEPKPVKSRESKPMPTQEPKPVATQAQQEVKPVPSQAPQEPKPVISQAPQEPKPVISQAPQEPKPVTSQVPQESSPMTPQESKPVTPQALKDSDPVLTQLQKPKPTQSPPPKELKPMPSHADPKPVATQPPQEAKPMPSHATPVEPKQVLSQKPKEPEPAQVQSPEHPSTPASASLLTKTVAVEVAEKDVPVETKCVTQSENFALVDKDSKVEGIKLNPETLIDGDMQDDSEEIFVPKKGYCLDFLENAEDPNFDPFLTKTTVNNSPVKKNAETADQTNNTETQSASVTETSNTKEVQKKPKLVKKKVVIPKKPSDKESPEEGTTYCGPVPPSKGYQLDFLDKLDDPNFDPFLTKTAVNNSPAKKNAETSDEKVVQKKPNFMKRKVDSIPKKPSDIKSPEEDVTDSSPVPACKGYQLDFLDRLDDPNFDPFTTKATVSNSPKKDGSQTDETPSVNMTGDPELGEKKDKTKKKSPIKDITGSRGSKATSVNKGGSAEVNENVSPLEVPSKLSEVSEEPASNDDIVPKKGYSSDILDKLDDPNFDPFTTKSAIGNSPRKDGTNFPADDTKVEEGANCQQQNALSESSNEDDVASERKMNDPKFNPFLIKDNTKNSPHKEKSLGKSEETCVLVGKNLSDSNSVSLGGLEELERISKEAVRVALEMSSNTKQEPPTALKSSKVEEIQQRSVFSPLPGKIQKKQERPKDGYDFDEFVNATDFTDEVQEPLEGETFESSNNDFIFNNPEDLDALSSHGTDGDKMNLVRNSLYVKFDPLVSGRQSLAPFLAQHSQGSKEPLDPRRASGLISFSPSPMKRQVPNGSGTPVRALYTTRADETVLVDNTLLENTAVDDNVNSTVVSSNQGLNSTVVHTSHGLNSTVILSNQEAAVNSTFQKPSDPGNETLCQPNRCEKMIPAHVMELVVQDNLLRQSREFEEVKAELNQRLEEQNIAISGLDEENAELKSGFQKMQVLMAQVMQAKTKSDDHHKEQLVSLKKDQEKKTILLRNEFEMKNEALQKENKQYQDDMKTLEASFFDMVKKYERLREVADALRRNEATIMAEMEAQKNRFAEKEEKFKQFLHTLEEKYKGAQADLTAEKTKHEQELSKTAVMMKRAQVRIVNLSETVEKDKAEIARLTSLLDDITSKFG